MADLHVARFADLDTVTLYELLRLRVDVFVVEQRCPYPELDGRDREPDTLHLWLADDQGPVAYLRIVSEQEGSRLGRVVTADRARGRGLAAQLLAAGLARAARPTVLHAQAHLEDWYARFGFTAIGEPFDEDGIPHIAMRLG